MAQAIIGTLLMGLVGLMWVVVHDILGNTHRTTMQKKVAMINEFRGLDQGGRS